MSEGRASTSSARSALEVDLDLLLRGDDSARFFRQGLQLTDLQVLDDRGGRDVIFQLLRLGGQGLQVDVVRLLGCRPAGRLGAGASSSSITSSASWSSSTSSTCSGTALMTVGSSPRSRVSRSIVSLPSSSMALSTRGAGRFRLGLHLGDLLEVDLRQVRGGGVRRGCALLPSALPARGQREAHRQPRWNPRARRQSAEGRHR